MGADRTEDVEDGREDGDLHHVPVQPDTPVTQRQSVRPAAPAEQVQPPRDGGRPTRNRRPPSRFEDYEMAEMSEHVRRTSSTDEEEDDVRGMLEDDILGPNQSGGDAAHPPAGTLNFGHKVSIMGPIFFPVYMKENRPMFETLCPLQPGGEGASVHINCTALFYNHTSIILS